MHHVSVRVPWHDTDWTGRVCAAPRQNQSCAVLNRIKKEKDPDAQAHDRRHPIRRARRTSSYRRACSSASGSCAREPLIYERTHAYARNDAYSHFAETTQRMAPHSLEVIPFRWMRKDGYERASKPWGITVHLGLEDEINARLPFNSGYMQDHRNQLALLDSFFSALKPGKSLVLLYAKDLPLVEQPEPGARYLIGAGFVDERRARRRVGVRRAEAGDAAVGHVGARRRALDPRRRSRRLPLPYQRLLAEPALQGARPGRRSSRARPASTSTSSPTCSELVTHDGAIAALTELARVVDLLPDVVDGPWDEVGDLDRRPARGRLAGPRAYPGLGPMLAAAGLERGPVLARRVLDDLPDGVTNPWPELEKAIAAEPRRARRTHGAQGLGAPDGATPSATASCGSCPASG